MKIYISSGALASSILVLLLTLLGCSISQRPVDNKNDIPQVSYRNDSLDDNRNNIADLPWHKFIANEELSKLIDTALAKNNDLQVAVKNIEIADELYQKAHQSILPTVGVSVNSNNSIPSENSLNGLTASQSLGTKDLNNYTASLGISWEADVWGKVKNKKREALADYLKSHEAKKGIQAILVASVGNGYYTLLMLDKQLEIAKKNLALSSRTLEIVKLQYESAQVTSLAVEQQEAQKLFIAQLIPKIRKEINIQENALSVLIGVPPAEIARTKTLDDITMKLDIGTGLPAELLSHRPDVKNNELELQAASARIGLAKANMYPSLMIGASGGLNSLKVSDWFNIPASLFGIVTGSLSQPILNGRELKTQLNVAQIEREKSVLVFRQSILAAYGEVSNALVQINKLEKEQEIAAARVSKLQDATRNADMLFKNGMANYLEVITAQSNVLGAELQLATLKKEYINASLELYRSLGGGWK